MTVLLPKGWIYKPWYLCKLLQRSFCPFLAIYLIKVLLRNIAIWCISILPVSKKYLLMASAWWKLLLGRLFLILPRKSYHLYRENWKTGSNRDWYGGQEVRFPFLLVMVAVNHQPHCTTMTGCHFKRACRWEGLSLRDNIRDVSTKMVGK